MKGNREGKWKKAVRTLGGILDKVMAQRCNGYELEYAEANKNNHVRVGLRVRKEGCNKTMTYYPDIDDMQGDKEVLADKIIDLFENEKATPVVSQLTREHLVENVLPKVFDRKNVSWLKKEGYAVRGTLDFAVALFVPIDAHDGVCKMSYQVREEQLESWNMTVDEAYGYAMGNLDKVAVTSPLEKELEAQGFTKGEDYCECPFDLIVATNKESWFGAASILSRKVQGRLLELFPGQKVVVVPSSVDEMLAVGENYVEEGYANHVVKRVNTMVDPEDRLTNHVYVIAGTPESPVLMMRGHGKEYVKQGELMSI